MVQTKDLVQNQAYPEYTLLCEDEKPMLQTSVVKIFYLYQRL
jgi:hypothetical protein